MARYTYQSIKEAVDNAPDELREGSLLSALLEAHDEEGNPLSDAELIPNLRLIILGGYGTVATVLTWAVIALARQPQLWEALCQEATKASSHLPTSPQEMKSFPMAEAIFRETVRYYAPIWLLVRKTSDWVTFHDQKIAPGTQVAISPAAIARNLEHCTEPERYDPSRWLGRNTAPTQAELVAFGGGPHFCIGYMQAWIESIQFLVALATVMSSKGLRPELVDHQIPKGTNFPFARPSRKIRIKFV